MLRCVARPNRRQSCSEGSKAALRQPPGVARPSARGQTHRQTHPTVNTRRRVSSKHVGATVDITQVLPFHPRHQVHTACNRYR